MPEHTNETLPASPLSRREALRLALTGSLGLASLPANPAQAASVTAISKPGTNEAFVPENDYPYFGAEPENHAQQ